jgi:hypothetical protein
MENNLVTAHCLEPHESSPLSHVVHFSINLLFVRVSKMVSNIHTPRT